MPYCTQDDLLIMISETELIQLTDDSESGAVDTGKVDAAIADADAQIEPYLLAKYTLPLTNGLGIVRKLSVDIALYNLCGRRSNPIPETRQKRYDNAVQMLTYIAKGVLVLGDDSLAPLADGGPKSTRQKSDRLLTIGAASTGSSGSLDGY